MHQICNDLYQQKEMYPVTLLIIPVFGMNEALRYLNSLFGLQNLYNSIYSALCTGQDSEVVNGTFKS